MSSDLVKLYVLKYKSISSPFFRYIIGENVAILLLLVSHVISYVSMSEILNVCSISFSPRKFTK